MGATVGFPKQGVTNLSKINCGIFHLVDILKKKNHAQGRHNIEPWSLQEQMKKNVKIHPNFTKTRNLTV